MSEVNTGRVIQILPFLMSLHWTVYLKYTPSSVLEVPNNWNHLKSVPGFWSRTSEIREILILCPELDWLGQFEIFSLRCEQPLCFRMSGNFKSNGCFPNWSGHRARYGPVFDSARRLWFPAWFHHKCSVPNAAEAIPTFVSSHVFTIPLVKTFATI